jgi:hypothetical protein
MRKPTPAVNLETKRERTRATRPTGVATYAAACFKMEKENPGRVAGAPRDNVLALFKPGTSPSGPARKLMALILHRAAVVWADKDQEWPADNVFRFTKRDLRTSAHRGSERLADLLAEVGGVRLVTPGMMRENVRGLTYVAFLPRYSIAQAGEEMATVEIQLAHEFADLVKKEEVFARLDLTEFLGLEGKVAVTLYQIGQLIVRMDGHPWQEIPIADVRQRLGLRKGEYETAKDLRKLLERSAAEVSRVSMSFDLRIDAIKRVATAKRGPAAAIRTFRITATRKTALAALAQLNASLGDKSGNQAAEHRVRMARLSEKAQRQAIAAREAVERMERMESPHGRFRPDSGDELNRAFKARAGAVDLGDE